jgi:hypothetical protein
MLEPQRIEQVFLPENVPLFVQLANLHYVHGLGGNLLAALLVDG